MTVAAHSLHIALKRTVEAGSGEIYRTSHSKTTPLRFPKQCSLFVTANPDAQQSPHREVTPAIQPEFVLTIHHIINTVHLSPVESGNT